MLRSYLTLAVRTLRRRLGYTAANVIGLTVGLACCGLVAVFLQHELTWDQHHADADRIYRIVSDFKNGTTYSSIRFEGFRNQDVDAAEQRALARRLPEAVPAIEQAAMYNIADDPRLVETPDGDTFTSDRQLTTVTGPALMDLFTFERLAGASLDQALAEPGSAVLTRPTAERYFGDQNPIGQTLTIGSRDVTVQAVIASPPSNSRLQFDLALQLDQIPNWAAYHYVRLTEGADPSAVAPKVSRVMDEVNADRRDGQGPEVTGERLQALTDIYLADRALFDRGPHGDTRYMWAFAAIGLLILVITTINYANLALALYADRNAEIGVRKAVGGYAGQIAGQFLVEAVVLTVVCVPLALGVCSAVLPAFNAVMDTSITSAFLFQPMVLSALIGLGVLTGLTAGGYPAFVLTRKKAINLFGRALSSGGGSRGWSLRQGLIGLQFAVLIGLGSLSWVAYDQLDYMLDDSLRMPTESVVLIDGAGRDSAAYQTWRRRLLSSSAVQAVGMGNGPEPLDFQTSFTLTGTDQVYQGLNLKAVDVHYFDVMGIEAPAIEEMKKQGGTAPNRLILNQTAADLLAAQDPVGKRIYRNPQDPGDGSPPIAGVVPDLQLHSMRKAVPPTAFRVYARPPWSIGILVRFAPGRLQDGMEHLRGVWSDLRPDEPFEASFLSEEVARLYEQERRFTTLSGVLAGIAVLLAALGLASLVAYLTRLRLKEIGVRKALGGSTASIVALLNKEYVQIVGVAFLVGAPLAWWAADAWLGRFASRIDLSPLVFLGSGLVALVVAVGAVSVQALRAARVDPARVLRSE